jgi:WD repeat-containing protein 68
MMASAGGAGAGAASAAAGGGAGGGDKVVRRKEVYTYDAPFPVYGLACSQRPGANYNFRFAIGSFVEEYSNKVQIIQVDDDKNELVGRGMFDHPYPATKIMWAPEALSGGVGGKDLLATAGDYLRLWTVLGDHDVRFEAVFNNVSVCVFWGGG